jgi:hypothetical protein
MKIKIIKKDGFRLWVPAPLSIIRWKVVYRAGAKSRDPATKDAFCAVQKVSDELYRVLKEWKKKSIGEFVLVDIKSADGDIVKITL